MEISKQCYILTESFVSQEKKTEDMMDLLDIYELNDEENIVDKIMIKEDVLEKRDEINHDVEEVMEDIIKNVENVIIKNEENKETDENMSVLTMESIHNEKKEDYEEKLEEEIGDKKEEEIVKKKKRTYKPRKKS
jgi:hypothetical protein